MSTFRSDQSQLQQLTTNGGGGTRYPLTAHGTIAIKTFFYSFSHSWLSEQQLTNYRPMTKCTPRNPLDCHCWHRPVTTTPPQHHSPGLNKKKWRQWCRHAWVGGWQRCPVSSKRSVCSTRRTTNKNARGTSVDPIFDLSNINYIGLIPSWSSLVN